MAPRKKPSKAEAAKAEVAEPELRSLEWKGLTFDLPHLLPEKVFLDIVLADSTTNPMASFRLLLTIIGEEQMIQVRNFVNRDQATMEEVRELLSSIFELYGTTEGESEASEAS